MDKIHSKFDPSGAYLAVVTTRLSSHEVQVSSVEKKFSVSLLLDKGVFVKCLEWGSLLGNGTIEDLIVLVGTNTGNVIVYSPANNSVIETFKGSSLDNEITGLTFNKDENTVVSMNDKRSLSEWSLTTFQKVKNYSLPDVLEEQSLGLIQVLNKDTLLISSNKLYTFNLRDGAIISELSNHINSINNLLTVAHANENYIVTSAENDRFINVYKCDTKSGTAVFTGLIVCQSNVVSISVQGEFLSAVTEEGDCEVFYKFLDGESNLANGNGNGKSSKILDGSTRRKKRSSLTTTKKTKSCDSSIVLKRPENTMPLEELKFFNSYLTNEALTVVWMENSIIPTFETIKLVANGEFLLQNVHELVKAKLVVKQIQSTIGYGHDVAASKLYNESNVYMTVGDNFRNLQDDGFVEIAYGVDDDDETFAEKLTEINPSSKILQHSKNNIHGVNGLEKINFSKPATGSLTTVLTQALQSNDRSLLDTVLVTKDETVIKQTLKNLSPDLSLALLDKLSERYNFISSVTSQAISVQKQVKLNNWIKWVLIIHGSYLKANENKYKKSTLLKNLSFLLINLNKKSSQLNKLLMLQNELNVIVEKVNYRNELIFDQKITSGDLKKTKNGILRYDSDKESDEEMDVEYNEDLDDAGLIDDGEVDMSDDDDDDDDESFEDETLNAKDLKDMEANIEDDFGDSDVEVQPTAREEMLDSEEEEEKQFDEKIAKMKKQRKRS